MQYTTLGRTGLRVSVAGLGTGGFSRMGLKSGKTEDEAARLVLDAVELGINFIDTAPPYGTEGVVGKALKSLPRDKVVVATKSSVRRNGEWWTPQRMVESLDNSLRLMGTDYVDVFNLHGVEPQMYDYALNTLGPALIAQKEKGKIRHIGLTENPIVDFTNETLKRALQDPVWEVFMVGFHMMHQGARENVFPATREKGVGTLLMFAVRSIFADPPRVAREMKELAAKGLVEQWLGDTDDPLGFLLHEHGAANDDRGGLPLRAARARRRRRVVRHRRRRTSAQQRGVAPQAAIAGRRPRQARGAVRPPPRRRARRPSRPRPDNFQNTAPAASRRNTLPGSAPVWTAFSTTGTPLTSTVVRGPLG